MIADTFPPQRTSGAVQLRDLAREFVRQGHMVTVLLPNSTLSTSWYQATYEGIQLLHLRSPKTKDIGYIRRTIGETIMPFAMFRNFLKSPLSQETWDGLVWYAPSIFHGPLVSAIKKRVGCKSYLIIRDIFPEWALDMGLMGRGFPYFFFSAVARYQYLVADVIGVQSPGNLSYFDKMKSSSGQRLEVLQNWLGEPAAVKCSIRISATKLARRKIFVYAGNMGVAQGMDMMIALAECMLFRRDVGFLFVGRGSDVKKLLAVAETHNLENVLFCDEIHPDEIPDLYAQCHVGLVALDPRHKSHNVPGKFLTYMQSGLPVLANINIGNDLAELIRKENIGEVSESGSLDILRDMAIELLDHIESGSDYTSRCKSVFRSLFSAQSAALQILQGLNCDSKKVS